MPPRYQRDSGNVFSNYTKPKFTTKKNDSWWLYILHSINIFVCMIRKHKSNLIDVYFYIISTLYKFLLLGIQAFQIVFQGIKHHTDKILGIWKYWSTLSYSMYIIFFSNTLFKNNFLSNLWQNIVLYNVANFYQGKSCTI